MAWAIDGSNLGGAIGGRRGARDAAAVMARILPWARRRRVIVFFDGPPDPRVAARYGRVEVRFSGSGSADDALFRSVRSRPRDWSVVTDDRELGERCRELGVRWVATGELAAESAPVPVGSAAEKDVAATMLTVEEWESYFGSGGNEDGR